MHLRLTFLALTMATPALAFDDCLIGRWQVDTRDIAQTMAVQMEGEASYVEGGVTMQINDDGGITMLVKGLTINVTIPSVPPMDVTVDGASRGSITAENGGWTLTVIDYDLVGAADVMGSAMTIPFNQSSGMFGGGSGQYTCDGDLLTFETAGSTPRLPRRWSRAR